LKNGIQAQELTTFVISYHCLTVN